MDINNSMNLNKSKSLKKNSEPEEGDIMMSMAQIPKSQEKSRITKIPNFKIVCKNNPKKIFDSFSDELGIHIISCNYCQKELLLYQAKLIKLENQLLNDKKEALEIKKRRRRKDVNDSMTDINLEEDDYDGEEDYEGEDYSEEYDEEAEYDEYEYDGEGDNNTSMIGGLENNSNNQKKNKSKKNKKDDEREKISEDEDEENSNNDEDDIEEYFLNARKKKKEEKKKYEENEEYEEEEEEGEGAYFNI